MTPGGVLQKKMENVSAIQANCRQKTTNVQ